MFRRRFHCVAGGDGGESNSPSRRANSRICYKLVRWFVTRPHEAPPTEPLESQPVSLWLPYRRGAGRIPDLWRLTSPLPGIAGSRRSRCYAARAKSRSPVVFCHLFNEVRWHLGLQSATGRPCRTRASPYTIYCPTPVSGGQTMTDAGWPFLTHSSLTH